ncbi:hypothetical protein CKO51_17530 [Rhodopirellula sp. SM50]|nr:hypothetical protein [Rhodopirellula sp. SM50]PAY18201.1 hypothetical protein CKO51_17530 [Rhodopirellula sp. SM50]
MSAAKYLVAFIFSINVCFTVYMAVQFFIPKAYGNGLHAVGSTIVLATTMLLGLSTRRLWTGDSKQGAYLFFAALAVSFIGNLVAQLFA